MICAPDWLKFYYKWLLRMMNGLLHASEIMVNEYGEFLNKCTEPKCNYCILNENIERIISI
jgi:hypothetical protein